MPLKLSQMIQAGLPDRPVRGDAGADGGSRLGGGDRQLAGPARAGRRARRDHALELPAEPDRRQGRPRPRRRLHRRAQAERGRAAQRLHPRRGDRGRRPARPASSTWSPAPGPVVGEAIAGHPGVDMVSFTGSTRAGRRVSELASATVKPVAMELGGKSPNVILDDADLARAVPDGVAKCYLNSGQTCSALTRMLVPREKLAEAEEIAAAGRRGLHARRPVRRVDPARAARLRRPARAGARLHREGRGRGGEAAHRRRRAARGPRPRLLRPPHRLLRGDARDDDRPGGDLRAGPRRSSPTRTRRTRCGSPTTPTTASPAASGRPTRTARSASPAASAPARSRSTAAPSTRSPRSAATSSPGHGRENGRYAIEELLQVKSLQL